MIPLGDLWSLRGMALLELCSNRATLQQSLWLGRRLAHKKQRVPKKGRAIETPSTKLQEETFA
jgi:hypothetical protein